MNKKRYVLVVSIILIGVFSLVLLNNKLDNKETVLDEVKLKENKVDKNSFAIMVQKEDKTGYDVYEESSWPTEGYSFNSELSGCIDNYGSIVENSMTYDNTTNRITIDTGVTSSCYVYFDLDAKWCSENQTIGECLIENPTLGLETVTPYSGMYRYFGEDGEVNNYIKLIDESNEVLYRIIGITSESNATLGLTANQVKLIKVESIANYNWHSNSDVDVNIKWESSAMYQYLNDLDSDITNQVLSNTSIIPSGWSNKISSIKWNIGDVQSYGKGSTVYNYEANSQTSNTSKIGLMYLSDYEYVYYDADTRTCSGTPCKCWLQDASNIVWTMTRYGVNSGNITVEAWYVYQDQITLYEYVEAVYAVRPVFYLNSTVQYVNGSGTQEDPFIVQ